MNTVTILYGTASAIEPWAEYLLGVYATYESATKAMEEFRKYGWDEFRFETWEVKK